MKIRTLSSLGMLVVVLVVLAMIMPVSAAGKGKILRVGPGQEYPTIQAAVDAARQGSTILVYPDPDWYTESVSITKNNLQIIAQGDGVVVEPPPGWLPGGFDVHADHVTIRGFDIAYGRDCAAGIAFEGSHNTFADNYIYLNHSCLGVNALTCRDEDGGSDFNTIEDNTIHAADIGIVMVAGTEEAINRGNIIQNNTLQQVAQTPIAVMNGRDFLVAGNHIDMAPYGHCIAVGTLGENKIAQGHHRIEGNTMGYCAGNGISLYADPGTILTHNQISDNIIQNCGADCIALEAAEGATLTHNVVSNNEASFSGICGIVLGAEPWDAADATVSNNQVRGNLVYRNLSGICLNPKADKNKVSNNEAQDHTADGIVVFGHGNRLAANNAHDNDWAGIKVSGDNNTMLKNTALNSGYYDLANEGAGNKWRKNTYETASWE